MCFGPRFAPMIPYLSPLFWCSCHYQLHCPHTRRVSILSLSMAKEKCCLLNTGTSSFTCLAYPEVPPWRSWHLEMSCPWADAILANSQGLMELLSRAQGEVSIREALRELELWGVGASFSLTAYRDSAGRELKLIKDWKDLVNQVKGGWERRELMMV